MASEKDQLLETITSIARLILLVFEPPCTKISIRDHAIVLNKPSNIGAYDFYLQGVDRWRNSDSKEDIYQLNPLIRNFIEIIYGYKSRNQLMYNHLINMAKYLCVSFQTLQTAYGGGTAVGNLQYYMVALLAVTNGTFHPFMLYDESNMREDIDDVNEDGLNGSTIIDVEKFRSFWKTEELRVLCEQFDKCFIVNDEPEQGLFCEDDLWESRARMSKRNSFDDNNVGNKYGGKNNGSNFSNGQHSYRRQNGSHENNNRYDNRSGNYGFPSLNSISNGVSVAANYVISTVMQGNDGGRYNDRVNNNDDRDSRGNRRQARRGDDESRKYDNYRGGGGRGGRSMSEHDEVSVGSPGSVRSRSSAPELNQRNNDSLGNNKQHQLKVIDPVKSNNVKTIPSKTQNNQETVSETKSAQRVIRSAENQPGENDGGDNDDCDGDAGAEVDDQIEFLASTILEQDIEEEDETTPTTKKSGVDKNRDNENVKKNDRTQDILQGLDLDFLTTTKPQTEHQTADNNDRLSVKSDSGNSSVGGSNNDRDDTKDNEFNFKCVGGRRSAKYGWHNDSMFELPRPRKKLGDPVLQGNLVGISAILEKMEKKFRSVLKLSMSGGRQIRRG